MTGGSVDLQREHVRHLPRPGHHGGFRRHGVLFGLRHAQHPWLLLVVVVVVVVGIVLVARSRR